MNKDFIAYNRAQRKEWKAICTRVAKTIDAGLPRAESRIWHGSPVWFIDGNPVVGYHVMKDCVRILFWSGQSFKDGGLDPEGSFKAAEKRYVDLKDVRAGVIRGWLKQAKRIQWDYKNIVKRRGKLVKIGSW